MKRILLLTAMVLSLVGTSFAASDPCKDKTEEAKKLYAKCKSMEKGSAKYKDCANSYKLLKNRPHRHAVLAVSMTRACALLSSSGKSR